MLRPKLVIGPATSKSLVIFGHGLGDTPEGWKDVCRHWSERLPHIKFVLPTAPTQPVSLNFGHSMTSWYDIPANPSADRTMTETQGIEESAKEWEELVKAEVANGDTRVVLAGFSQGGAMALYTAARHNVPNLVGVLSMSAYLPPVANLRFPYNTLLCHGTYDDMVQFSNAEKTKALLTDAGANVKLRSYPMQHNACEDEVEDITEWYREVLPAQD